MREGGGDSLENLWHFDSWLLICHLLMKWQRFVKFVFFNQKHFEYLQKRKKYIFKLIFFYFFFTFKSYTLCGICNENFGKFANTKTLCNYGIYLFIFFSFTRFSGLQELVRISRDHWANEADNLSYSAFTYSVNLVFISGANMHYYTKRWTCDCFALISAVPCHHYIFVHLALILDNDLMLQSPVVTSCHTKHNKNDIIQYFIIYNWKL